MQKHAATWSHVRRLKARETAYMPLMPLTPMALEIDHRESTNRVCFGQVCASAACKLLPRALSYRAAGRAGSRRSKAAHGTLRARSLLTARRMGGLGRGLMRTHELEQASVCFADDRVFQYSVYRGTFAQLCLDRRQDRSRPQPNMHVTRGNKESGALRYETCKTSRAILFTPTVSEVGVEPMD